jgi:hypothetical protein
VAGYQVASGLAKDSIYPFGTIEMQRPYFEKAGVDFSNIYSATLNVNITSGTVCLISPFLLLKDVKWSSENSAETFSLFSCNLIVDEKEYSAYVYYPHPETKLGHFQDSGTLEILSEYIEHVPYGTKLKVVFSSSVARCINLT